jgi:alkylhydroperoxidase family enzyme
MLAYAVRLAKEPWAMSLEDVESLRRLGFSDRAILAVNLVTSYMSSVNRVAQGLGVELEEYFHQFNR